MITLDTLRAALLSDHPYARVDELVRSELAAGRLTRAIRAEMLAHERELYETPGFGDDADEAYRETLDCLIGYCQRKYAYHNPPVLPSEDEVTLLPTWARVAFAARCARRVVGLFSIGWTGHPDRPSALRRIVRYCEESAALARVSDGFVGIMIQKDRQPGATLPESVSDTVYHAATAANFMIYESDSDVLAARVAGSALSEVLPIHPHLTIRRDFDYLLRLSDWLHWAGDTPVPPDVFGPLWPEGAPDRWPADPDVPPRNEFVAAALVKDDTPLRHVRDELLNVFNAVNRYYIARTGQRLTLDGDLPLLVAALVPEGSAT